MRVERLQLLNFCQHSQRTEHFSEGLTAIMGANGSGKSNFLGGIRLALTGENTNSGTKADNVRVLADPTQKSFVEMDFTHGEISGTIRRMLKPASHKATMTLSTGEVIEGDRDITARIEEILGVSTSIINDLVIVSQEDIFGFISKTPAKRAEQFQRLFRTQKAASVHKTIGDKLKSLEIPTVATDLDQCRAELVTAGTEIERLRTSLATIATYEQIAEGRNSNQDVIRKYDDRQQAISAVASAQQERDQVASELSTARQTLSDLDTLLGELEEALSKVAGDVSEAQRLLTVWDQNKKAQTARDNVEAELAKWRAVLGNLVAPPVPSGDRETYWQEVVAIDAELANLQAFVGTMADGVAECPTCGTPATTLAQKVEQAKVRIPELLARRAEIAPLVDAWDEYGSLQSSYQTDYDSATRSIAQYEDMLKNLPSAEEIDVDVGAQQAIIADEQKQQQLHDAQVRQRNAQQSAVANLEGRLESLTKGVDELQTALQAMPNYTAEQRGEAVTYIESWNEHEQTRRDAETALAIAETKAAGLRTQISDAEAIQQQAEKFRQWRDLATEMRALVHKDAAPRFVAQRNLEVIQSDMNAFLELFETDYRVHADEGLSFVATFQDGTVQPAERLSGGQKVILALTFRLAINLLLAENIGALYLDEPTAYLDEHHIRGFEPVLGRLREFAASRGLQCMIVTHETELAPLFDSVITL